MPTPNPFPLAIVNKVNSPELLAFLQQFGHDKYADATDINKILQALQFIYENLGGAAISDLTKFTVRPTIDISGTAVLVSDDGEWIINGVPYAQTEGASFSFSLNDEGNERFVLIIAGTDGDYNTVEGEQSATNPATPPLPLNCLLVSVIFITDSTITEIPLSAIQDLIDAAEDNQLSIGPNGKLYINVAAGSVPDATETVKGKIQIATEAQRVAGSNDSTAITPLKLKATADEVTEEAVNYSDNLVNNLLDGVSTPGNTLLKLYNLILGVSAEDYVADITARNAYNIPHLPFSLFVTDDGDGKWAKYQATTTGVGATFVKISDPDLLNAVMSAAAIKAAYESNSDTNAFTNALKTLLLLQSGTNTGDETTASIKSKLGISTLSGSNTGDQDLSNLMTYSVSRTGGVISFDALAEYNSFSSPTSSNITDDLTGAKKGVIQKIYSNKSTAPTFPAGWVKLGSGSYLNSSLNIIYAEWVSGSRVEYWIVQ